MSQFELEDTGEMSKGALYDQLASQLFAWALRERDLLATTANFLPVCLRWAGFVRRVSILRKTATRAGPSRAAACLRIALGGIVWHCAGKVRDDLLWRMSMSSVGTSL